MSKINATALTLESIPLVDAGVVAAQFNALLTSAIRDCEDRPGLSKARKVTLEISLTPNLSNQAVLEDVLVEFTMSSKVPGYATGGNPMLVRQGNRLLFQPLAPDDPRQDPLPNIDRETGELLDE